MVGLAGTNAAGVSVTNPENGGPIACGSPAGTQSHLVVWGYNSAGAPADVSFTFVVP